MISQKSMVRCPECMEPNMIEHWNESTQKIFGPYSAPLEDVIGTGTRDELWYICPACEEQVDIENLEVEKEMKKVRFSKRGSMEVEIFYDIGIELEVPADMDDNDVQDYIESDPQLQEAFDKEFNKGIQKIHDKLEAVELEYEENGGQHETWVEEI